MSGLVGTQIVGVLMHRLKCDQTQDIPLCIITNPHFYYTHASGLKYNSDELYLFSKILVCQDSIRRAITQLAIMGIFGSTRMFNMPW